MPSFKKFLDLTYLERTFWSQVKAAVKATNAPGRRLGAGAYISVEGPPSPLPPTPTLAPTPTPTNTPSPTPTLTPTPSPTPTHTLAPAAPHIRSRPRLRPRIRTRTTMEDEVTSENMPSQAQPRFLGPGFIHSAIKSVAADGIASE